MLNILLRQVAELMGKMQKIWKRPFAGLTNSGGKILLKFNLQ
jgi:hypothetical protein